MKVIAAIFLLAAGLAAGSVSLSGDIVGEGSLWTATDHGAVHDRAGGLGDWAYGHVVGDGSLISLYSFDGSGGRYSAAYRSADYSTWLRAFGLSTLNADVSMGFENETTIDMAGTGQVQSAIYDVNPQYGRPTDLSRTYISGKFQINRTVKAW